jgi:hypothetical protein
MEHNQVCWVDKDLEGNDRPTFLLVQKRILCVWVLFEELSQLTSLYSVGEGMTFKIGFKIMSN